MMLELIDSPKNEIIIEKGESSVKTSSAEVKKKIPKECTIEVEPLLKMTRADAK